MSLSLLVTSHTHTKRSCEEMNPHFSQPLFTLPSFGSGFSWRLRRLFLEDGILVSQPSPLGEGAPQGRIGHWRHERQMRKAEKCAAHVGKRQSLAANNKNFSLTLEMTIRESDVSSSPSLLVTSHAHTKSSAEALLFISPRAWRLRGSYGR